MIRTIFKRKGAVLFIVLGTILIVMILANIILNIMLSQSRLTQHQVSRIQAYYASLAGMNYALEEIRINELNWTFYNPTLLNAEMGINPGFRVVASSCAVAESLLSKFS